MWKYEQNFFDWFSLKLYTKLFRFCGSLASWTKMRKFHQNFQLSKIDNFTQNRTTYKEVKVTRFCRMEFQRPTKYTRGISTHQTHLIYQQKLWYQRFFSSQHQNVSDCKDISFFEHFRKSWVFGKNACSNPRHLSFFVVLRKRPESTRF